LRIPGRTLRAVRSRTVPQREVAGGAFRGGGRQVMPRRDAIPAEAAGDPLQKGVDPEEAAQEALCPGPGSRPGPSAGQAMPT